MAFGNECVEAVNKLLNEKGAGKTAGGSIDIVWINGENFRTAKQAGIVRAERARVVSTTGCGSACSPVAATARG